jgi:hypothetical protein
MALGIGPGHHGAELVAHEPRSLETDTLLLEKYGTAGRETEQDRHGNRQEAKKRKGNHAAGEVDHPLPGRDLCRFALKQVFYTWGLVVLRIHAPPGGVVDGLGRQGVGKGCQLPPDPAHSNISSVRKKAVPNPLVAR